MTDRDVIAEVIKDHRLRPAWAANSCSCGKWSGEWHHKHLAAVIVSALDEHRTFTNAEILDALLREERASNKVPMDFLGTLSTVAASGRLSVGQMRTICEYVPGYESKLAAALLFSVDSVAGMVSRGEVGATTALYALGVNR